SVATSSPRRTSTRFAASYPTTGALRGDGMASRGDGVNVGIVGCGLVGRKRAAALAPHRLVAGAGLQPAPATPTAPPPPRSARLARWGGLLRAPRAAAGRGGATPA